MTDIPQPNKPIVYRANPPISSETLNALFAAAWENHTARNFDSILRHSLAYICAFADDDPVGFVNLAWDGGIHAFVLSSFV